MIESLITTNKSNPLIDPQLHVWGWQVSLYLFLGGLTAGILVLAAGLLLTRKSGRQPLAALRLPLLAPLLISAGMFCLFLDLEFKRHVWRFYGAFRPTSPMSWGSWILLLVYPASLALILATLRRGYPEFLPRLRAALRGRPAAVAWLAKLERALAWFERRERALAAAALGAGALLGAYTGVLLSALAARPFWNSAVLAPLFLTSGISGAVALAALLCRQGEERHAYAQLDGWLIGLELALLLFFVLGLASAGAQGAEAARLVLGGPLTGSFWVLLVGFGLFLPLLLEFLETRGRHAPPALPAALALFGGLALRFVMVEGGQISRWIATF